MKNWTVMNKRFATPIFLVVGWVCAAAAAWAQAPVAVAPLQPVIAGSQQPDQPPPQAPPQPQPPGVQPPKTPGPQPPQPPGAPQPRPPAPPGPPAGAPPEAALGNVRIELTITDQTGSAPAVKKTVIMTLANGSRGSIRTTADVSAMGGGWITVPLNVDATPNILSDNRVFARLTLEYGLAREPIPIPPAVERGKEPGEGERLRRVSNVHESVSVTLTSGVPLVVAQSADPHSDRRVSLEVKATVLRTP